MITIDKKVENCADRKEYLIRLAIAYIREHTGYVGMEDLDIIFYDGAECDGYCLADDLADEFNIDE